MHRTRRIVGIVSAGVLASSVALAAEHGAGKMPKTGTPPGHQAGQPQAGQQDPTTSYVSMGQMYGKVASVDKEKGRIEIESEGDTLSLKIPAAVADSFKTGDQVVVRSQLALTERDRDAAGARGTGTGTGTSGGMR